MHRIRVSLVLLSATLLIAACAPVTPRPPVVQHYTAVPPDCRDHGKGVKNLDAPVVCVDDLQNALKVDRERFWIHDRLSAGGGGSPVVHWFSRTGTHLEVRFADERCVRNITCNKGRCTAIAARLPNGSKQEVCKYDVFVTGHPLLDPEGVLTSCCLSEEP